MARNLETEVVILHVTAHAPWMAAKVYAVCPEAWPEMVCGLLVVYRRRSSEERTLPDEEIPTLHIHGTRNWLLSIRLTNLDFRIEGGHLLVLNHPENVNRIIRKYIGSLFTSES